MDKTNESKLTERFFALVEECREIDTSLELLNRKLGEVSERAKQTAVSIIVQEKLLSSYAWKICDYNKCYIELSQSYPLITEKRDIDLHDLTLSFMDGCIFNWFYLTIGDDIHLNFRNPITIEFFGCDNNEKVIAFIKAQNLTIDYDLIHTKRNTLVSKLNDLDRFVEFSENS